MAGWDDILTELGQIPSPFDSLRQKYLSELSKYTKRCTIAYYSSFLDKTDVPNLDVNDSDMEGFMNAVKGDVYKRQRCMYRLGEQRCRDRFWYTP